MALLQSAALATINVRRVKDITVAIHYCSHHHQTLFVHLGLLNKDAEKDTLIRVCTCRYWWAGNALIHAVHHACHNVAEYGLEAIDSSGTGC